MEFLVNALPDRSGNCYYLQKKKENDLQTMANISIFFFSKSLSASILKS